MTRRSRFFLNSFLRFAAAAGFPVVTAASGAAFFCCSFGTIHSISSNADSRSLAKLGHAYCALQIKLLALLAENFLLRRHRTAPRTLACSRVLDRCHRSKSARPKGASAAEDLHLRYVPCHSPQEIFILGAACASG